MFVAVGTAAKIMNRKENEKMYLDCRKNDAIRNAPNLA